MHLVAALALSLLQIAGAAEFCAGGSFSEQKGSVGVFHCLKLGGNKNALLHDVTGAVKPIEDNYKPLVSSLLIPSETILNESKKFNRHVEQPEKYYQFDDTENVAFHMLEWRFPMQYLKNGECPIPAEDVPLDEGETCRGETLSTYCLNLSKDGDPMVEIKYSVTVLYPRVLTATTVEPPRVTIVMPNQKSIVHELRTRGRFFHPKEETSTTFFVTDLVSGDMRLMELAQEMHQSMSIIFKPVIQLPLETASSIYISAMASCA